MIFSQTSSRSLFLLYTKLIFSDAVGQENHFAQVATFEQQLELMRYLRSLNLWLERDAQDRTDELRGVYERIQRLRGVVHDIQLRGWFIGTNNFDRYLMKCP